MTSGPDTFGAVESKATVAFPAAEPTPSEVAQTSRTALLLGGAGTLLGLVGLLTGLLALRHHAPSVPQHRGDQTIARG